MTAPCRCPRCAALRALPPPPWGRAGGGDNRRAADLPPSCGAAVTAPLFDSTGARVRHYTRGTHTDGRGAKSTGQRDNPEERFQKQTVEYLTFALPPGVLFTATLNGMKFSPYMAAKAKAQGLRRGVADILICIPGKGVRALELKAGRNGLTDEQREWAAAMRLWWVTVRDLAGVEAALVGWGVTPRCEIGRATRYGASSAE